MSENTWRIVQNMQSAQNAQSIQNIHDVQGVHGVQSMRMEDVELQMAIQCAPVITGIKISNLLNIRADSYRQAAEIVSGSDISMYTLGAAGGRVTVFLFDKAGLCDFLRREEVRAMLRRFGYEDCSVDKVLPVFRVRYQEYLRNRRSDRADRGWFPHEMGLLLGYPPEDVEGFIRNQGKNSLCTGYWRVYENAEAKKCVFRSFERAEERLIRLLYGGVCMRDIMDIYTCKRKYA